MGTTEPKWIQDTGQGERCDSILKNKPLDPIMMLEEMGIKRTEENLEENTNKNVHPIGMGNGHLTTKP